MPESDERARSDKLLTSGACSSTQTFRERGALLCHIPSLSSLKLSGPWTLHGRLDNPQRRSLCLFATIEMTMVVFWERRAREMMKMKDETCECKAAYVAGANFLH